MADVSILGAFHAAAAKDRTRSRSVSPIASYVPPVPARSATPPPGGQHHRRRGHWAHCTASHTAAHTAHASSASGHHHRHHHSSHGERHVKPAAALPDEVYDVAVAELSAMPVVYLNIPAPLPREDQPTDGTPPDIARGQQRFAFKTAAVAAWADRARAWWQDRADAAAKHVRHTCGRAPATPPLSTDDSDDSLRAATEPASGSVFGGSASRPVSGAPPSCFGSCDCAAEAVKATVRTAAPLVYTGAGVKVDVPRVLAVQNDARELLALLLRYHTLFSEAAAHRMPAPTFVDLAHHFLNGVRKLEGLARQVASLREAHNVYTIDTSVYRRASVARRGEILQRPLYTDASHSAGTHRDARAKAAQREALLELFEGYTYGQIPQGATNVRITAHHITSLQAIEGFAFSVAGRVGVYAAWFREAVELSMVHVKAMKDLRLLERTITTASGGPARDATPAWLEQSIATAVKRSSVQYASAPAPPTLETAATGAVDDNVPQVSLTAFEATAADLSPALSLSFSPEVVLSVIVNSEEQIQGITRAFRTVSVRVPQTAALWSSATFVDLIGAHQEHAVASFVSLCCESHGVSPPSALLKPSPSMPSPPRPAAEPTVGRDSPEPPLRGSETVDASALMTESKGAVTGAGGATLTPTGEISPATLRALRRCFAPLTSPPTLRFHASAAQTAVHQLLAFTASAADLLRRGGLDTLVDLAACARLFAHDTSSPPASSSTARCDIAVWRALQVHVASAASHHHHRHHRSDSRALDASPPPESPPPLPTSLAAAYKQCHPAARGVTGDGAEACEIFRSDAVAAMLQHTELPLAHVIHCCADVFAAAASRLPPTAVTEPPSPPAQAQSVAVKPAAVSVELTAAADAVLAEFSAGEDRPLHHVPARHAKRRRSESSWSSSGESSTDSSDSSDSDEVITSDEDAAEGGDDEVEAHGGVADTEDWSTDEDDEPVGDIEEPDMEQQAAPKKNAPWGLMVCVAAVQPALSPVRDDGLAMLRWALHLLGREVAERLARVAPPTPSAPKTVAFECVATTLS